MDKGSITLLEHHCKTLDLQHNKVLNDKSRKLYEKVLESVENVFSLSLFLSNNLYNSVDIPLQSSL